MRTRFQIGITLWAAIGCFALPGYAFAQRAHPDRPPESHPAQPQPQVHKESKPPANQNRPPAKENNGNRPSQSNFASQPKPNNNYHPPNNPGARLNPRQQIGAGAARPWVDTMRDLSPAQRDRVLQNSRAFQSLSPDKQNKIRQQFNQWDHMTPNQRANLRQNEQTWRNLTPEQRDHIKNDVLPKWRQMPWDRQQVMKQKLGVLQNMPESARNERLNDPNFTRGMSDDEKSMLHDLSHTHVGAPDTPNE
jgi:hypothetical protein